MFTGTIHTIQKSPSNAIFIKSKKLENPNGLVMSNNNLLVASWGPGLNDDFSTNLPGSILSIDEKSKKISQWAKIRIGNLDGIEVIDDDINEAVATSPDNITEPEQPQDLFIFNVVAKDEAHLGGHALLQFFLTSGFRFGDVGCADAARSFDWLDGKNTQRRSRGGGWRSSASSTGKSLRRCDGKWRSGHLLAVREVGGVHQHV